MRFRGAVVRLRSDRDVKVVMVDERKLRLS